MCIRLAIGSTAALFLLGWLLLIPVDIQRGRQAALAASAAPATH